MKEFIVKLIARLGEEENDAKCLWEDDAYYIGIANAFGKAIGIINQLAEEWNGGWIPVSERLPEQKTVRCEDLEFQTSELVVVTLDNNEVMHATYECDKWYSYEGVMIEKNVVAWQPAHMPVPYKC